ncbi:MAG TPA: hypothetical protein VKA25_13145, partial [Gemmatimonadales bacterium]|nr:hypothetical protein [Gemmatimonadales bacterium]
MVLLGGFAPKRPNIPRTTSRPTVRAIDEESATAVTWAKVLPALPAGFAGASVLALAGAVLSILAASISRALSRSIG